MRRRLADSIRHDFETLTDIDNKCSGYVGDVDPVTIFGENLQAFNVRQRGLEQKGPPA
jgi:hypothetical protein